MNEVEIKPDGLKAAGTAILAGLITLGGYLSNGEGFVDVTAGQWVAVLAAALGVGLGVYAFPARGAGQS